MGLGTEIFGEMGFMGAFAISNQVLGSVFTGNQQAKMVNAQYRHQMAMNRLDSKINGQQMIHKVKSQAIVAASQAAAVLSVAAIDVGSGTPNQIIQKSFSEANREVEHILRTTAR